MDYDFLFKIVIMGESGVGKTSLYYRYIKDIFQMEYRSTIGVDFNTRELEIPIDGIPKKIKMQLWDTAGQERFKAITKSYLRGTHGLILVFALNDMNSFEKLKYWLNDAGNVQYILCIGNKADLVDERVVSEELIKNLCETIGRDIVYMETSARTGQSVDALFLKMATELTRLAVKTHIDACYKENLIDIKIEERLQNKGGGNKCCGGTG